MTSDQIPFWIQGVVLVIASGLTLLWLLFGFPRPSRKGLREYMSIRVSIVQIRVRKSGIVFPFQERELGRAIAIPDNAEKAMELFSRIQKLMREYGVEIEN